MIGWILLGIYMVIGVLITIWAFKVEPILLEAGYWVLAYILISIIIWPYILYCILTDNGSGRWI